MSNNMNAIIIGDHPFVRIALKTILEKEDINVIRDVPLSLNAIQTVKIHQPDMVILDATLRGSKAVDLLSKIRTDDYLGRVIVASGVNNAFHGRCSIHAGANAFVGKKEAMENIIAAIHAVKRGYNYTPLTSVNPSSFDYQINSLSEQEFKIMKHVLNGAHNHDIAAEMLINHKTVSTYKRRLMFKLNCRTLKELFVLANNKK